MKCGFAPPPQAWPSCAWAGVPWSRWRRPTWRSTRTCPCGGVAAGGVPRRGPLHRPQLLSRRPARNLSPSGAPVWNNSALTVGPRHYLLSVYPVAALLLPSFASSLHPGFLFALHDPVCYHYVVAYTFLICARFIRCMNNLCYLCFGA